MRNGFKVVDTDCHQMEPLSIWSDYIDPAFKDRAPCYEFHGDKKYLCLEGEPVQPPVTEGKYPMHAPEFMTAIYKAMERFNVAREAKFSPLSRINDMDAQGVDVQIIYPTVGGQFLGREFKDPELLLALCRAYNDWSREYCSYDPKRLRWAAMLPLQSTDLAIEEAKRAASGGAVAFYIRPNPILGRNLYHQDNWPLWKTIEALNIPISLHDSGSPRIPSFGDRMDSHTTGHILGHPFEAMAAMAGLIWFGIPESFPKLRFVHVESDAGWVPFWLQRMEQHWEFSGAAEHELMKKSPTEYFKQNFFVAARGDEVTLKSALELVGEDYFLFNTDYPHPDGTFPWGIEKLINQPLNQSQIRKIFWDNPAKAFGLGD